MKIKRILSVFLTTVLLMASVSALSISASAAGFFEDAITMKQLEYYSPSAKANTEVRFKITIPSDGKLSFRFTDQDNGAAFKLFNSNAEQVSNNDYFSRNQTWEIKDLKKGVYYLSLHNRNDYSLTDLYYTFTPDKKADISLKLSIKKGTTVQLGSMLENYKGSVSWLSTAKSVASVSKTGAVKGLKKGTTVIRASIEGGAYAQIRIVVTG